MRNLIFYESVGFFSFTVPFIFPDLAALTSKLFFKKMRCINCQGTVLEEKEVVKSKQTFADFLNY